MSSTFVHLWVPVLLGQAIAMTLLVLLVARVSELFHELGARTVLDMMTWVDRAIMATFVSVVMLLPVLPVFYYVVTLELKL